MARSKHRFLTLAPLIGVTAVVSSFILFSILLDGPYLKPTTVSPPAGGPAQMASLGRAFNFVVSASLLIVALLYVISLGFHVARTTPVRWISGRHAALAGLCGAVLMTSGVCMALGNWVGDPASKEFTRAIETVAPGIRHITLLNDVLTVLAVLSATAMSTVLLTAFSQSTQKRQLPDLVRKSQLALYSSATLLTIGVVEIFFLCRWGASLMPEEGDLVQKTADSMTLGFGVFFSAILVVLFVPLLLVQRDKLKRLNTGRAQKRAEWLEQQGLSESLFQVLGQIGALFMPFAISLLPM